MKRDIFAATLAMVLLLSGCAREAPEPVDVGSGAATGTDSASGTGKATDTATGKATDTATGTATGAAGEPARLSTDSSAARASTSPSRPA